MKTFFLVMLWISLGVPVHSQRLRIIDSLQQALSIGKEDNNKVQLLGDLSDAYLPFNTDSAHYYANKGLQLAKALHYKEGEAHLLCSLGNSQLQDLPEAFKYYSNALQIATKNNDFKNISWSYWGFAELYMKIDPTTSNAYFKRAKETILSNKIQHWGVIDLLDVLDLQSGLTYLDDNQEDSAFKLLSSVYKRISSSSYLYPSVLLDLGRLESKMNHMDTAIDLFHSCETINQKNNDHFTQSITYYWLGDIYKKKNPDSAIYYEQKAFDEARQINQKVRMIPAAKFLAELNEPRNISEAYRYSKIAAGLTEELYGSAKVQELQKLLLEQQEQQQKSELDQLAYRNKMKQYLFFAGILILSIIAFILLRNNIQRKRINNKLQSTLNNLKATQSQLIQSEKMASLGELTAGIAHEIQNPLNFVNNFSEVSNELLEEMKGELEKGNKDDAITLAEDVKENLEKILLHGKRADAIVKGMLQHSRSSSGQKEPTDINALCDEYLKLAYHGLRAKDKTFNAKFETHFDPTIGKINVIPQEIGRVVLNLINNAFYAVHKKVVQGIPGYEPAVTVATRKQNGEVEIQVRDNGNGIPESIKEKIFQPFFTTKPTGSGTGLGLSLSYDIIKAHGGEMSLVTEYEEGAEFIVRLPLSV